MVPSSPCSPGRPQARVYPWNMGRRGGPYFWTWSPAPVHPLCSLPLCRPGSDAPRLKRQNHGTEGTGSLVTVRMGAPGPHGLAHPGLWEQEAHPPRAGPGHTAGFSVIGSALPASLLQALAPGRPLPKTRQMGTQPRPQGPPRPWDVRETASVWHQGACLGVTHVSPGAFQASVSSSAK